MLTEWLLTPDVTYLNHGTVGATPRRILAVQQSLRDEIERGPAQFMLRELSSTVVGADRAREPRLRAAAREVAAFVGARGSDLVFTANSTSAVNAVLRSFDFRADDEILLLEHCYGAVRKAADYVARRVDAHVGTVRIPFPGTSEDSVVRAVEAAITSRTRIAIVDHITSPSALVIPVARIAEICRKRGVAVLVDGAHAPGAIALDVSALGVDWYTGNLHKWCWAPRSCALFWVDPARQPGLHPTTISWGLDQGLTTEFDWIGTRDPTPQLAAPAAIALMREFDEERVRRHNHELAWAAGQVLSTAWGTELPAQEGMIGSMIAVRLPPGAGSTQAEAERLRDWLLFAERIEVHLQPLSGALWCRVSAQIYNDLSDIERLAQAIRLRFG
jgi:isopenicillin-N epimerase